MSELWDDLLGEEGKVAGVIEPDYLTAEEQFLEALPDQMDNDPGYVFTDAALEMLAKMYLREKPLWGRAVPLLRERKAYADVRRAVREFIRKNERAGELAQMDRFVVDVMEGAPVEDQCIVPKDWLVKDRALYKLVEKVRDGEVEVHTVKVALGDCVISAIATEVRSGETYVEIAWRPPGSDTWLRERVAKRKLASTSTGSAALGPWRGLHINPRNAPDFLKYLDDYQAHNAEYTPHTKLALQMGHCEGGFLLGKETLGGSEMAFHSPDEGEAEIAEALSELRGTMDGWIDTLRPLGDYPRVRVALYASLAAPLLKLCGGRNFVVEWCGQTSTGKTTALEVAASVWGNPDTRNSTGIVGSWGATKIGIERRMALLNDLPCLLDDTKLARVFARGQTIVPSVIYAAVNGQGDTRGSLEGLRAGRRWRTVLLSTGEQRLVDFDRSAGTAARILAMWGSPFGGDAGEVVKAVREGLGQNYGHAGRAWVAFLLSKPELWPQWASQRQKRSEAIVARMPSSLDAGVAGRIADCLAVLDLTAWLAVRALGLPFEDDYITDAILEDIASEAQTSKRHHEALAMVRSWVASNKARVINAPGTDHTKAPHAGWIGYQDDDTASSPCEFVALFPHALDKMLRDEGYEPRATLRAWAAEGWLRRDKDHNTGRVTLPDGSRTRMVVLTRRAMPLHDG